MQQQRHLAAILFTDIVGYTAMMQKDEQQAVAVIRQYSFVLEKAVADHQGEIVNNYGDGSLCTFHSATEAVNCAIQIQQMLSQSGPSVPLRIGLHIGELYFEDGNVFGDGVNVASRIQSLGQANTILFSKEIFDKIRNQSGFKSVSLGNFEFKNVDEPMEVFALTNEGLTVPKRENMEGKLKPGSTKNKNFRKKIIIAAIVILLLASGFFIYSKQNKKSGFTGKEKSIAVLPFNNLSSDKDNEYFSDGMTEEITTQLSKIADLKVIARTSAMLYKGSKKSIKEIAEDLGVSAILEGSVQKSAGKIRITAQLIDANTQEHIWADKYDRELKDIFVIQSEVAEAIATQLNARLTKEEKKEIEKVPTNNLEAYNFYLQGRQLHTLFWEKRNKEYFENSRSLFEKALALDSNYALAHAALADLYNTFSKTDKQIVSLQLNEIVKAWKIDSANAYVNFVRGTIEQDPIGNKENAFRYFKKMIEKNPNEVDNLWGMAMLLGIDFGMLDEAKVFFEKLIKLDPLTANNPGLLGVGTFYLGNYTDALNYLQAAIRLDPEYVGALDALAHVYCFRGKMEEAKKMIEKSFQLRPSLSDHWAGDVAYVYAKLGDKKKAVELARDDWQVLLAAGMKEEALKEMPFYDENEKKLSTSYLIFKSQLSSKDFDVLRNDERFLKIMERNKKQYEENKSRFSIINLLN